MKKNGRGKKKPPDPNTKGKDWTEKSLPSSEDDDIEEDFPGFIDTHHINENRKRKETDNKTEIESQKKTKTLNTQQKISTQNSTKPDIKIQNQKRDHKENTTQSTQPTTTLKSYSQPQTIKEKTHHPNQYTQNTTTQKANTQPQIHIRNTHNTIQSNHTNTEINEHTIQNTFTQNSPTQSQAFTGNAQFNTKNCNVVFIEPISTAENLNLLEPMEVGKFLNETKLDQFREIRRAGKFRYKLMYKNATDSEKIINSVELLKNNNYRVYIPQMMKETTGIIKDIPLSITENEVIENAISEKQIIRVERILRKNGEELVKTKTMKVTVEGQELPRNIQIYGVYTKIEIYIYPLRICKICWRLGHKSTACKSKPTCLTCGRYFSESHQECPQNTKPKCRNCGKDHLPTDKNCEERKRKELINIAMIVNKMTYTEAEQLYPKAQTTYSNKTWVSTDEFPIVERPSRSQTSFRYTSTPTTTLNYSKIAHRLTQHQTNHTTDITQNREQTPTPKNNTMKNTSTPTNTETQKPVQIDIHQENNPTDEITTIEHQLQKLFNKITNYNHTNDILEDDIKTIELGTKIEEIRHLIDDIKKQTR